MLGVPTIADRVAQTVVAMHLEQRADDRFHPDSYGYRPGKSAHEALAACRQRCWKDDWVIDLDVQKFFDEVPWDLVLRAVQAVTDARWVQLYVERWLAAALQHPDGVLEQPTKGTPQGSAVSPILANLFMHYAFDSWMARNLPACPFERYADDVVVHCKTRRQAEHVLARIAARMQEVGLRLHPDKTRIVYCKDGRRRAEHEHTSFTSGTASGHGGRAARTAGTSPASCRRSAPRRSRPKAPSSARCGSTGAPTCRSMAWRGG
jgi:RNA-directed DNA polymerase